MDIDTCELSVEDKIKTMEKDLKEKLAKKIIRAATISRGFFRQQQKDEPDLSLEEKEQIVTDLLLKNEAEFLNRYGRFLSEDLLGYFENGNSYEVDFYLEKARQENCRFVKQQRVKNRRYQALQNMLESGSDYFKEAEMKRRNPLLYNQLIGQYMSEEEKEAKNRPDTANCKLSDIILEHIDITDERDKREEEEEHENVEEFDTDSDEEDDGNDVAGTDETGRDLLRQEFVRAAYNSFLEGRDEGFDYRNVDNNSELDNLDIEERDAEERYFDDEDAEERYFDED